MRQKGLAFTAVIAGLAIGGIALGLHLTVWGPPGSAAYNRYELLNRLMAGALLLAAAGWLGWWRYLPAGRLRWPAALALVGLLGMAAGTAAEFWLFSELPYRGFNLRQVAFSTFSIASLLFDLGCTWLGLVLWRQAIAPRRFTVILLLALPIDLAAYFLFGSIFINAAVQTLNLGWLLHTQPPAAKFPGQAGHPPHENGTSDRVS